MDTMAEPFLVGNQDHELQLSAQGLGLLQRADSCPSTRTRRCSRCWDDLRRQRPDQLRAARLPGRDADSRRQRPYTWRTWRRAADTLKSSQLPTHTHPCGSRQPTSTATNCAERRVSWRQAPNGLRPADNLIVAGSGDGHHGRRQPGAPQHAAVPDAELLHRPAGHLPVADLETGETTMAQPYVGEIRMFGGNFAPAGWMFCEGQLLPISENETLFQLIGTTYGGDGRARSRCRICGAEFRFTWARDRPARPTNGESGGVETGHADGEPDTGTHSSVPGIRPTPATVSNPPGATSPPNRRRRSRTSRTHRRST